MEPFTDKPASRSPIVVPPAWGDGVASLLGLLMVVGLGTLGGWAMVLVFKSLMQAQEVVIQNGFAFQR